MMPTQLEEARMIFKEHHGMLRTVEALRAGIHPRTLYSLRDNGTLEQVARGLFRLTELPPASEPDLLAVAKKVPRAVICLRSALAYYQMTTQVPHAVEIALPHSARVPSLDHPPLMVYRFSPASFEAGMEINDIDGIPVRIYSREKALADMFKYRSKVGIDVAVEALRIYRSQPKADYQAVLRYARVCRVDRVIRPYLEAII